MIFGQDRNELRQMYTSAWQKRCANAVLSPLEAQIATVIEDHPEYHDAVTGDLEQDFAVDGGQTNPFLHMGMHIAIQEQLSTDRPAGIAGLYTQIVQQIGDAHEADHKVMECLGEMLWQAQRDNRMPDEGAYLNCLKKLAGLR